MSPDFSIVADKTTIASLTGDSFERPFPSNTNLKNPPITGHVRLRNVTFETLSDGRIASCCSRIFVRANGNYFDGRTSSSSPVSLIQSSASPVGSDTIFEYRTLDFSLPSDGSPVELSLSVDGETKIIGSISLAEDVIVLPVHVHIFTRPGVPVHPVLSENHVRSWFGSPSIAIELQSTSGSVSGFRTYTITNEWTPIYTPANSIWKQANIQFSLESYDLIENVELESQIISSDDREFLPREVHNGFRSEHGMHIYVGRNVRRLGTGLSVEAGITRFSGCGRVVTLSNAIALAWDIVSSIGDGTPNTVAHEIGHYLGLDHTNDGFDSNCGNKLLDDPNARNLMEVTANNTTISPKQANRARAIACEFMRLWDISSPACR